MIDDPAELHDGVVQLFDGVTGVRRHLAALRHRYLALDPEQLDVDDLGPEVSVPEAVAAVHGGLIGIDEELRIVTDATYDAIRHTARLKVKGGRP